MTALLAHWAIASLIAHLAYGAVLGAIAAEQRTPLPGTERYRENSWQREHDYLMRNKMQCKG